MNEAARTALTACMGLKNGESCLIVTDEHKMDIAEAFHREARAITDTVEICQMPVLDRNGQEPPEDIASKMLEHDVIMIATSRSISHTNARKKAAENGARIASMPGITVDMARRCLNADYNAIQERTGKLVKIHDEGETLRVVTALGTDITMSIKGLNCRGNNEGMFHKPGRWGNLPAGESNMAPAEGSANGVFVVDQSMAGIGKLDSPIRITVKDGMAVRIEGGREAEALKKMLEDCNDERVFNIAEIGIGTNDKAVITGSILEDEKVMGTCHIALGNNMCYEGGTCDVPLHLDGIMDKPTIWIDDKKVMEEGNLLI